MTQDETYSPQQVANYFIEKALESGVEITHLKLQKLLYFAHGWSLALRDKPLLNVPIQAWQYGPVVEALYHDLKEYGKNPINKPIGIIRPARISKAPDTEEVRQLLDRVWFIYGKVSAGRLSDATHAKGTPWRELYDEYKEAGLEVPNGTLIPNERIKKHFEAKMEHNRNS
jgi:uncharacterized phage-associated protein